MLGGGQRRLDCGDFLGGYRGPDPFFLYVTFTVPHDPRTPPKGYETKYDPAKLPVPKNYLPQHPFNNGEMLVQAATTLDVYRTMAWLLLSAVVVIGFNLIADLLYAVLDPRIRYD